MHGRINSVSIVLCGSILNVCFVQCVRVDTTPRTWTEASAACTLYGSERSDEFSASSLDTSSIPDGSSSLYWIGAITIYTSWFQILGCFEVTSGTSGFVKHGVVCDRKNPIFHCSTSCEGTSDVFALSKSRCYCISSNISITGLNVCSKRRFTAAPIDFYGTEVDGNADTVPTVLYKKRIGSPPHVVLECKYTSPGQEYRGTLNITETGKVCQRWDRQNPHRQNRGAMLDGPASSHENYCRNPDNEVNGPWCYTIDPSSRFEFCNVSLCRIGVGNCAAAYGSSEPFSHQYLDCSTQLGYLCKENTGGQTAARYYWKPKTWSNAVLDCVLNLDVSYSGYYNNKALSDGTRTWTGISRRSKQFWSTGIPAAGRKYNCLAVNKARQLTHQDCRTPLASLCEGAGPQTTAGVSDGNANDTSTSQGLPNNAGLFGGKDSIIIILATVIVFLLILCVILMLMVLHFRKQRKESIEQQLYEGPKRNERDTPTESAYTALEQPEYTTVV